MMTLAIKVGESSYLESSARLRGVSRTALVQHIVEVVLRDQMILSVLDDADELEAKIVPQARPPAQRLFSNVAPPRYVAPKKHVPTKSELREQLAQAVVNTGGRRITLVERKAMVLDKLLKAGHPMSMGEIGGAAWWIATDALVQEGTILRIESTNRVAYRGEPSVRYTLQSSADSAVETPIDDGTLPPEATPATGDVDA